MRRRLGIPALALLLQVGVAGARPAPLFQLRPVSCPGGFGASLAVLGDAVFVGGPEEKEACARVAAFDALTGTPKLLLVSLDAADRLGGVVAAADGTIAVAAANTCTVQLFDASGRRTAVLRSDLVEADECFFGAALGVGGGRVAVGGAEAGILLFDAASGRFLRAVRLPGAWDAIGLRLALSDRTLFVGAPGVASAAAHEISRVFAFDAATGRLRWVSGPPVDSHLFGVSLAVDGRHLVVGSFEDERGRESVALFDARTGKIRRVYRSPRRRRSDFGASVALRGDRVLIGAPDGIRPFEKRRGRAFLFARASGWRLATYRAGMDSEHGGAGSAVALGHGIAVVGAPYDGGGSVTVFRAPVE